MWGKCILRFRCNLVYSFIIIIMLIPTAAARPSSTPRDNYMSPPPCNLFIHSILGSPAYYFDPQYASLPRGCSPPDAHPPLSLQAWQSDIFNFLKTASISNYFLFVFPLLLLEWTAENCRQSQTYFQTVPGRIRRPRENWEWIRENWRCRTNIRPWR